jgi:hypothetical protein
MILRAFARAARIAARMVDRRARIARSKSRALGYDRRVRAR